ncbi:MAG TPA: hypothetical protein VNT22_03375 [Baekduia sp.]|nr:hypothetical protein [Baekduia sp.]
MPDGIHATMDAMKSSLRLAPVYGAVRESRGEQLRVGNHAVLPRSAFGDR